jgi:hypothetical protein
MIKIDSQRDSESRYVILIALNLFSINCAETESAFFPIVVKAYCFRNGLSESIGSRQGGRRYRRGGRTNRSISKGSTDLQYYGMQSSGKGCCSAFSPAAYFLGKHTAAGATRVGVSKQEWFERKRSNRAIGAWLVFSDRQKI